MKQYIKITPAELMLIQLAMGEYNEAVKAADTQKAKRLSAIADSHPEAKDYTFEVKDNELCLAYEDHMKTDAEDIVPPPADKVKKPLKPKSVAL